MSVQTPQSRTWPNIFAARGDGPGRGRSPICLIPPIHSTPPRESEHGDAGKEARDYYTSVDAGKPHTEFNLQIEEMFKETVSNQGFSSKKTKIRSKQASVNDEEALAGIMKEISTEVESFQTLYNNQWFNNKSKATDAMKPMQHGTKPDALENIIKLEEFPLKARSNKDTHSTKNIFNKLSMRDAVMQSSKPKIREHDKELESELSKLNLSQKTVSPSPSHTEHITNEKVQQKVFVRSVSTLTDAERQDVKKGISVISTNVTQTENVATASYNATQTHTSGEANRPLHKEVSQAQSEVDDSENPLTEAERQTFKDAINAMNAEAEREEKRAAKESSKSLAARRSGMLRTSKEHRKSAGATEKTPIWSSSSIARVDVKKYNRQSVTGKVPQPQSGTNKPQDVRRVFEVHADKQKAAPEPLMKREMQEKQKAPIHYGFPYTKPKSLTSIPNIRNGNFQAGFVKPVPLETSELHVSPSAPLVSKHYSGKNMRPTTSQSKLQRRHTQVK